MDHIRPNLDDYDVQRSLLSLIPHRYPFLFVDKILALEPGQSIRALKNVSNNEEFFLGHFPGDKVFPGVLMLEFMAQAAAICSLSAISNGEGDPAVFLTGVDDAKFKKIVRPGDVLMAEVECVRSKAGIFVCKAQIVDYLDPQQTLICSATLKALRSVSINAAV